MKLYVTYTSPYARLARIVVIEKALEDRVEIIEAKTRTPSSPYYHINPSGRVPISSTMLVLAWKTASLSAPIWTALMASRASTSQRSSLTRLTCGSSFQRAACAMAFQYGHEKWLVLRMNVPPLSLPMKLPAANAWQMFLRVTWPIH